MKAHWLDGSGDIPAETLRQHGVVYRCLELQPDSDQRELDVLKKQRGYVQQDIVELHPQTPNLEAICQKFLPEHLHDDDEVRYVLEGEGIFDIRSTDDRWMRVTVEPGDLIVVPRERYHRFMLTDRKQIRCVRLFKDESGWVPHYRADAPS